MNIELKGGVVKEYEIIACGLYGRLQHFEVYR